MRGQSHSEGLRNFRELQVCDPVPSRKGLATFPGSKITIKTKIGMNQFCKNCDEALKLHAVTNWYGQSGFTFRADDHESIVTFAAALRTVEGIEDVEVSKPNDYGIVTVSYTPTSAMSYAIGIAISSSFKSE